MIEMPMLTPVQIPTKVSGFSFFQKIKAWVANPRTFKLVEDWHYTHHVKTTLGIRRVIILIPGGFVFDGASIPRPLWFLLNPFGILMIPGLVHDYAYKYQQLLIVRDSFPYHRDPPETPYTYRSYFPEMSQKSADQFFLRIGIEVNGMPYLTRLAYFALRLFGSVAWRGHRKRGSR